MGRVTWQSLKPGDVVVGQIGVNDDGAYVIIKRGKGKIDHDAVHLYHGTFRKIRADDNLIRPDTWEVFRAER